MRISEDGDLVCDEMLRLKFRLESAVIKHVYVERYLQAILKI